MDLDEAMRRIEVLPGYRKEPLSDAKRRVTEVCSGGVRFSAKDPCPCLYLDTVQAIRTFFNLTYTLVHDVDRAWWWERRPALERHIMTEQDARGSQRIAQDRWAVTAAFAVEVC